MIRLSETVRSTHSQDGGIVLDIQHGRMFRLNFVGSRILELLKKNYEATQIAEEISRDFGVSLEIATADVREFLDVLEKQKLVEMPATCVSL
jgi:hypothetical protein